MADKMPEEDRVKRMLKEQVVDLIENGWLRGFTINAENKFDYSWDGSAALRETITEATLLARDKDGAHVEIRWTRTVGR